MSTNTCKIERHKSDRTNAPNISLPVYIKSQPVNIESRYFLAIAIAFDSLTYDVREGDKKAIVGISVASGEITSPLTMK